MATVRYYCASRKEFYSFQNVPNSTGKRIQSMFNEPSTVSHNKAWVTLILSMLGKNSQTVVWSQEIEQQFQSLLPLEFGDDL
jgi:hypothetical protein